MCTSGDSGIYALSIPQVCNPTNHDINVGNMSIKCLIVLLIYIQLFLLPLTDLLVVNLSVH